jgi:hypothetical protein
MESFVITACIGRPASHNQAHARRVVNNAMQILNSYLLATLLVGGISLLALALVVSATYALYYGVIFVALTMQIFCELAVLCRTVAWLHDVADHKYASQDPTLEPQLEQFLDEWTASSFVPMQKGEAATPIILLVSLFTSAKILAIIERISFARQEKLGTQDWFSELGFLGCLVRDIVSDADKRDALGSEGMERCKAFVYERHPHATEREAIAMVAQHYDDKLKKLGHAPYMRTWKGRALAKQCDSHMVQWLRDRT